MVIEFYYLHFWSTLDTSIVLLTTGVFCSIKLGLFNQFNPAFQLTVKAEILVFFIFGNFGTKSPHVN